MKSEGSRRSAVEIAIARAKERTATEEARRKADAEERREWEKQKRELSDHVDRTMKGFHAAGLKVIGWTIYGEGGCVVAELKVEFYRLEVRHSDESAPQEVTGYHIVWTMPRQVWKSGSACRVESFDEQFGEAMSDYL